MLTIFSAGKPCCWNVELEVGVLRGLGLHQVDVDLPLGVVVGQRDAVLGTHLRRPILHLAGPLGGGAAAEREARRTDGVGGGHRSVVAHDALFGEHLVAVVPQHRQAHLRERLVLNGLVRACGRRGGVGLRVALDQLERPAVDAAEVLVDVVDGGLRRVGELLQHGADRARAAGVADVIQDDRIALGRLVDRARARA